MQTLSNQQLKPCNTNHSKPEPSCDGTEAFVALSEACYWSFAAHKLTLNITFTSNVTQRQIWFDVLAMTTE